MRRIASGLLAVALVAFHLGCSADAPAPTPPNNGGGGPGTTPTPNALTVRLFTSNANPTAGTCTLIQAIVSLNGANVPDGTGVAFSTDFGTFQQNGSAVVSVTTQGSAAVTAVCSLDPGLANVRGTATVSGHTGSGNIAISFQPSAQAAPFFTSCSPSFGSNTGGEVLVLNGGRFFGDASTTRVEFTAAGITREALVDSVSTSAVTLHTPAFPEAVSPSVPVTIKLTLGTNTASPFVLTIPNCFVFGTVAGSTPSVTAILPSSGPNSGLTRVTIVGSGFSSPLQVFFGTVEAQVLSVSFNQIIALSPPAFGAGSSNLNATVTVRVHEVNSGVDSAGGPGSNFRFVTPVQITAVDNNQQRVDSSFGQVTIHGNGFEAPVAVSLAGIAATVISVSGTEIVVLPGTPFANSCADISGAVSVTNINTGNTASGSTFIYLIAQTAPVIQSISPGSGPAGTQIAISGFNLGAVSSITIGGRSVGFSVQSNSLIFASAPDFTTGPTACPAGTSAGTQVAVGAGRDIIVRNAFGCTVTAAGAFQPTAACVVVP